MAVSALAAPLSPADALATYLARSGQAQSACSDSVYNVQVHASLPRLRRQGSMSGLKVVSQTGEIVYRGLKFTGDSLVKRAVIARFLADDAHRPAPVAGVAITHDNYTFAYTGSVDYNGLTAYVFQLKPKRKRVGLFRGELWLEASTGMPLRLWGDLVKSPSIFIRSLRFVQDYQELDACVHPLRLILTLGTRVAGTAEMVEWLHPVETPTAASDAETDGFTKEQTAR
jgi:hypothetical protein